MSKFENSPPPSDYEIDFDDFEFGSAPLTFTLPFPKCRIAPKYLPVDFSLTRSEREKKSANNSEKKPDETAQESDKDINKNLHLNSKNVECGKVPNAATDQKSIDEKMDEVKKRAHNETGHSSKAEDETFEELLSGEPTPQKKRKHSE